jgi:hypothetical protein
MLQKSDASSRKTPTAQLLIGLSIFSHFAPRQKTWPTRAHKTGSTYMHTGTVNVPAPSHSHAIATMLRTQAKLGASCGGARVAPFGSSFCGARRFSKAAGARTEAKWTMMSRSYITEVQMHAVQSMGTSVCGAQ